MPDLEEILSLLKTHSKIAVLTGAGISAESGVPTFRDPGEGLWADYDPEKFATREGFSSDPRKVWEWYDWRRKQMASVRPNPGHLALARWEEKFSQFTLITQNIDNLHQLAGSRDVIELHGNIHRNKCFEEDREVGDWQEDGMIPPRCPRCGGMLRPDVVWFGEILPAAALRRALDAAQNCDFFFSIGTSALVEPAASLPFLAAESGARLIEINLERTPLSSRADLFLEGPAGKILPALFKADS